VTLVGPLAALALLVVACAPAAQPSRTAPPASATATAPAADVAGGPSAGAPAQVIVTKPAATVQGTEIKIGLITVTEGSPFAANGKRAQEGARFAVKEINDAGGVGGVPVSLIEADTRGEVNSVANIIRRMATEDRVLAIIGPLLSGECRIGCPLANELKVPLITPGAAQGGLMAQARPYAFRLVMPDDTNTYPVVQEIIKRQNVKKAAIIMDEKEAIARFMGETFWPRVFNDSGVEVVETVTFTTGEPSFAAQVTRLKAAQPQAVALVAGSADAARIALEIKRQGFEAQLLGSGGLQSTGQDFMKAGGDAVEGTMTAAQFDPDNPDPAVQALIKSYREKTGQEVSLNTAYAYDAVYLIVDQINRMGVTNDPGMLQEDRDRIKDGLDRVKDWVGMGGATTLGSDGEVRRPIMIATVKNGEFVIETVR
jgi:branched-chain amino acid transport system substrate-binding protein